ncbi:MAG: hypothetical protein V1899_03280 [Planctomycetota bacterium]
MTIIEVVSAVQDSVLELKEKVSSEVAVAGQRVMPGYCRHVAIQRGVRSHHRDQVTV